MILHRTTAFSFTSSQDDITSEAVCVCFTILHHCLDSEFHWPLLWFLTSDFAFLSLDLPSDLDGSFSLTEYDLL